MSVHAPPERHGRQRARSLHVRALVRALAPNVQDEVRALAQPQEVFFLVAVVVVVAEGVQGSVQVGAEKVSNGAGPEIETKHLKKIFF